MAPRTLKQTCLWLSKPLLLHWILPYLIALITIGTVAQKYIGLYESQKLYFSSFFFWLGFIPLPGGRTVSALLLISLSAKLIFASPWHKLTSGIFITHLGVMLLLLGGLVTSVLSTEGYVALAKGDSTDSFYDYHQRQLVISKNNVPVLSLPFASLSKTRTIRSANLPFILTINDFCYNCTMAMRTSDADNFRGPARKIMLSPLEHYLEDERNFAGIEFTVLGAGAKADGTYIAFEPMEKQPGFVLAGDTYTISLGRKNYPLPFTLTLLNAHKESYPGTDVPRSYRSMVMLTDGAIKQRAVITMNHPLRYKGYTVYQSSFSGEENSSQSVSFAVVQNSGRVFPYVASITLCLGLLLHLSMRLPALLKKDAYAV